MKQPRRVQRAATSPWGTGTYHIPTSDECQKCHRGRTDRILGFEQSLLGLAGATGLTLDRLVAGGRLTAPPASTQLTIGDDGTTLAAPALAWLHVNCGTTCHNRNSDSTAWSTGLFMRLDPTQLDGRSVSAFDALTTTVGIPAVTPQWKGQPRIVAHDPAGSLVFQLISHRGQGGQMPPIATSVVDWADVPLVEAWIEQMKPAPGAVDAGVTDAGADAPSTGSGGGAGSGGGSGAGGGAGAGGSAGTGGGSGGGSAGMGGGSGGGSAGMGGGSGGGSAGMGGGSGGGSAGMGGGSGGGSAGSGGGSGMGGDPENGRDAGASGDSDSDGGASGDAAPDSQMDPLPAL